MSTSIQLPPEEASAIAAEVMMDAGMVVAPPAAAAAEVVTYVPNGGSMTVGSGPTQNTAAIERMAKTPPFIMPMGLPKTGKSLDEILSFPRARFFAQAGSLRCGLTSDYAYMPHYDIVGDLDELNAALRIYIDKDLSKRNLNAPRRSIVVDDATMLARNTETKLTATTKDGRAAYKKYMQALIQTVLLLRQTNEPIVFGCHAEEPFPGDIANGKPPRQGGPAIAGQSRGELLKMVDAILLVTPQIYRPWPNGYATGGRASNYITGDRLNVVVGEAPLNLGEIVRASGYLIQRAPGLEWQDDLIEEACQHILAGSDPKAVKTHYVKGMIAQNATPPTVLWFLRDLEARVELRQQRQKRLVDTLQAYGVTL